MESAPSFQQQYETFLAQRATESPRSASVFPERPRAWLALAPSWPAQVVGGDFPGDRALLDQAVAAGEAHLEPCRPPYEGDIYWMDDGQRSLALRALAGRHRSIFDHIGHHRAYDDETSEPKGCGDKREDQHDREQCPGAVRRQEPEQAHRDGRN